MGVPTRSTGATPEQFGATLRTVPTTRPRHVVTETDAMAAAIDRAQVLYPGKSRAAIVRHLIDLGAEALHTDTERRAELVAAHAGRFPDLYRPDELAQLRAEWRE